AEVFEKVYAIDLSLTMAYQFYSVLADDVVTYAVHTINRQTRNDMARRVVSELPKTKATSAKLDGLRERLLFFVGDALHTPFPLQSVSAIVSVFFTDVVPLNPLLDEITRLLAPCGVFVHFGPLLYHSRERACHLAVDEVRDVFRQRG